MIDKKGVIAPLIAPLEALAVIEQVDVNTKVVATFTSQK
jgi:hypothetical protein